MFSEIFRHFLSITYPQEHKLQSISGEKGFVVVKNATNYNRKTTDSANFPSELAPTCDMAEAVIMFLQCNAPLGDARSLVEMLIRRMYSDPSHLFYLLGSLTQLQLFADL